MTLENWLKRAAAKLKEAGIGSARLDAQILAETVLKQNRSWLAAHGDFELKNNQIKRLDKLLDQRSERQPLAYVTKRREFYGLDFIVTPDVLIPRPETESLAEEAIKLIPKGAKVLEIGTGSGCIAVALKTNRPDLDITSTDVSKKALDVAQANAKKHSVEIRFLLSDMFEDVQGRFDAILANLPYVPVGARRLAELDFEPQVALYAGADGLEYYRPFFAGLRPHLTEAGSAIIEAGPTQRRALKLLANNSSFRLGNLTEYVYLIKQKM